MFIIHTSLRDPSTEGNGGAASTGANPFAPASNTGTNDGANTTTQQQSVSQPPTNGNGQQQSSGQSSQPTTQGQSGSQPTQQTQTQQQQPGQVPPQLIGMTPEQLTQLAQAMRPPTDGGQQGQPQMTEADFKKAFNVFEASPELYEQILGVKPTSPAQVAALNDALQSVSRQSVTIMRYLMDQKLSQVEKQFQPVQQTIQQQKEQQYFNEFVGEYPGLKDYGPMLKEIVDAARARGMQFADVGQAKNYVAAQAAKLLGKQLTDFKTVQQQTQGNNQTSSQQSGARTMSTTSMGGRSGSSGGAAPTQSTAERLFAQ